jgi:3-oxoacyl-[acyl-carrier-protein] synthase III
MLPLRLIATGVALPARTVTSAQLDVTFNRSPGTTLRHSGVHQRHVASDGETQSRLGAAALAASQACARSQRLSWLSLYSRPFEHQQVSHFKPS